MGAYLSKPVTEKISTDENSEVLMYGASSMQGWRVYQEDAHNAILDFDKDSSLFAVYDGHGGHEVATYTAAELPKFIKNTEAFSKGQFTQALSDAFLEFDAILVKPKVLMVLKDLAGSKDQDDSDYDGEEVDHLCREAAMPLEEVMAKYCEDKHHFQSPNIRLKENVGCSYNSEESCSLVDDGFDESFEAKSEAEQSHEDSSKATPSTFVNEKEEELPSCDNTGSSEVQESSFSLLNGIPADGDPEKNVDSSEAVNGEVEEKARVNWKIKDEGGGGAAKPEGSKGGGPDSPSHYFSETNIEGGEAKKGESEDGVNGDAHSPVVSSSKGKGKSKGKGILSHAMAQAMKVVQREERKRKAAERADRIYQQIQCGDDDDDDDDDDCPSDDEDEDEEDDNFEGSENCQGLEDTSSSEEEDKDDDSDLEEQEAAPDDAEDDSQYQEFSMNMREEPGYDSGCTACVAILNERDLFVANVGDSRCVVCRDGKALDMSVDHKPEDEPEASRITKAGGRITSDGRVNGGLNLSRALGDHSYKQNKNQSPAEQMISPLPDVRSLTLTLKDSFLVIACDGIWNSMSSQEVCDFISERIETHTKLSTIAEEMFDRCLSPDAHGDGTGCDNMTCIIVKLHALFPSSEGGKRACEGSEEDAGGGDSQKSANHCAVSQRRNPAKSRLHERGCLQ